MTTKQFQENLLTLQPRLLSFSFSLTGNKEDAEDLLQETTLKALKNKEKFVNNVNFKGWIFTIMRNIFINNYRLRVNRQTFVDNTEDSYLLNTAPESELGSPEGNFIKKEILETIDEFTTDYKQPFTMHIQGYKYQEIADAMSLPIGTVKSRIFFARKKLMHKLKDYATR